MDVSIIIVNYNTKKLTSDCINSIYQYTTNINFEVIVVDNASNDGSVDLLKKDKRIILIESSQNLGFGRANNLGYTYATGKYIFLLNSDTILLNNAVKILFDYLDNVDNQIGCVGSLLLNREKQPMHSYGNFPNVRLFKRRVFSFVFPKIVKPWNYAPSPTDMYPKEVDYITGADIMIRKNIIEQYGLFDPDFFMFFEETEMQYRYAQAGYKRIIIDTPKIIHLAGGSGNKKKYSLSGMTREIKSRFIYCNKVLPLKQSKTVLRLHLLLIPRILFYPTSWQEKKDLIKLILTANKFIS